jgi:hypothetical protein
MEEDIIIIPGYEIWSGQSYPSASIIFRHGYWYQLISNECVYYRVRTFGLMRNEVIEEIERNKQLARHQRFYLRNWRIVQDDTGTHFIPISDEWRNMVDQYMNSDIFRNDIYEPRHIPPIGAYYAERRFNICDVSTRICRQMLETFGFDHLYGIKKKSIRKNKQLGIKRKSMRKNKRTLK